MRERPPALTPARRAILETPTSRENQADVSLGFSADFLRSDLLLIRTSAIDALWQIFAACCKYRVAPFAEMPLTGTRQPSPGRSGGKSIRRERVLANSLAE